jgi:hypothetical protein
MKFTKGNLALKGHLKNGKRVFLFESESKGLVRFKNELEFYDVDYFETKSRLMLITGHSTMTALEQYLRDIDAELPEDYSHLLE